MRKLYALIIVLSIAVSGIAQSTANYAFTTTNNGSLALDMNGNAVDMSTGTTQIFGASQDNPTAVTTTLPAGFTFYFMGLPYTQFSTSGNGVIRLGSTAVGSATYAVAQANQALIAAFARDLATNSTGKIHYKVIGTAPNRTLVIEWVNMELDWNSTTADGTYQMRLYEGTNVIEFVYGAMKIGTAGTATNFSIGFSSSNTDNTFATVNTAAGTVTSTGAPTTNSYTAGAVIPNLNSAADGSRTVYRFTPPSPAPTAPSNLTFTSVVASGMTLNWVDNATNESNYIILRSTDGVTYTQFAQTAANATSFTATGLNASTTYYWNVYAMNESGSSATISGSQATVAGSLSGVKTVGSGGDYSNLTTAFADINTNGLAGNITLQLIAGYPAAPETYPITSSNSIVGTYTVSIYPTVSGLSITSANATGTLNLNGAKNITIDGRVNATGTSPNLVIANTATSGYAVQFINDANGNALKYNIIQGVNTSASSGVVVFSTSTGTVGNSNNSISDGQIRDGASTPANGIYSSGSTTAVNSNNTITNNSIFNFFAAGTASNGILLSTASSAWTITNNSFYQTAARTSTAGSTHTAITVSNTTNGGFTISNNTIGGSDATGGGTAWTLGGAFGNKLIGISISAATTPVSSIQGNTIANISLSSNSSATTAGGVFSGIYIASGAVNVGTTAANTIGSGTGTGSITVSVVTNSGGFIYGIYSVSSGTVAISNNVIGSVNIINPASSATYAQFYGIRVTSGTNTISGNNIGSSTTALSINNSAGNTSTTLHAAARGISAESGTSSVVTNNNIYNIGYTAAGTQGQVQGINITSGTNTVSNNVVAGLSNSSANAGTGTAVAIMGIYYGSSTAPATVSQNKIYDLSSSAATAAVTVRAFYYGGPTTGTNVVSRNLIHSLSTASTSTTASIEGIYIASGIGTFQNNMVRLGVDKAGASLTNASYVGIDKASSANVNIYHNSVYIGGSGVTVNANSVAFRRSTTATDDVRNNIFANVRSNASGTGKHFAIGTNNTTTLTSDFNDLYVSGTGTFIGYNGAPGASDYPTLTTWKVGTSLDANSIAADPKFVAPAGSTATLDLHVQMGSPIESAGVVIAAVTDDYDGQTRASLSPADIGADAGDFIIPGLNVGISAHTAPATTGCYTAANTVSVTLKNYGSPAIDFATNPVTVTVTATGPTAYTSSIVINSGTLATNATQTVTLPATINMTAQGTYTFASSATVGGDINTSNDTLVSVRTSLSLGGVKTVGIGGDYTTLTAAVAAYNSTSCITGPIEFSLLDATYPGETFPIVINQNNFAGSNTLTIHPAAGVNATISGSSASAIIKLNGADNVIIDGSNNGTTTRNLTISNTSTSASTAAIWISSLGTGAGAQNAVIKNASIMAGSNTATTYGIYVGGTSIGTSGNDNDNLTITNNVISKAYYGINASATAAAGANNNLSITDNSIGSATAAEYIGSTGILLAYAQAANVSGNTVYNIITTNTNPTGISISTSVLASTFDRNNIYSIRYTGASGYGGKGIDINTGSTAANLTISNNMVSDILGDGWSAFTSDAIVGIRLLNTQGGITIDNNSVNLSGSFAGSASGTLSAALYIGSASTNLTIRNNIFSSSLDNTALTTDKTYAIYSAAAATAFTLIDYNDYYVSGIPGVLGFLSSDRIDIAAIRTGFGNNVNSRNIKPYFVSNTDAHIDPNLGYQLDNLGTPLPNVTNDIDGDPRDPVTPDMGADEFTPPPSCSGAVGGTIAAAADVFCNSGSTTITAVNFSTGPVSSYQWESSLDGNTWTSISGQVNPNSLATGTLTDTTYFRLKVTCNTGAATDYSNVAVVTINPNPTVAVSASASTICPGSSSTLTATSAAANTYTWSPATGLSAATGATVTATPTTTTTYTVTGKITATGCTSTATQTVVVAPVPSALTITPSSAAVCPAGSPVSLSVTGGAVTNSATTGTNATTTTANSITPFTSNYEGSRMEYLVRASELSALGLIAGNITELTFKVTSSGSGAFAQKNFTIKMAHTAQTAMASAYGTASGPFTTVYTNVAGEPAPAVGNKTFVFSAPFAWDGTSNILIDICHDNDPTVTCASCFSGNSGVAATTTSFNSVWGSFADNAPSCGVQAANTTTTVNLRPDMTYKVVSPTTFTWTPASSLFTDAAGTVAYTGGNATTVYALPATATTYTVTSTSSIGCTSTANVAVSINQVPAISTQPVATAACVGSSATFTVVATGTGLTYQWRKNGVNLPSDTSATLVVPSVTIADAGQYSVVVSGTCAPSVTSSDALLTINTAPSISTEPVAQTVCYGSGATFSVTATGTALTYQWRKNGVNISGATGNTYTVSSVAATSAGNYDVIVSGTCSPADTSVVVALNAIAPVTISTQPLSQTICPGSPATFAVAANNASAYQWKKDGVDIPGATTASLNIPSVSSANTGTYTVVISGNGPCGQLTSSAAILTLGSLPQSSFTVPPVICVNTPVTFINTSVIASGSIAASKWNFGDGNTSTSNNGTNTFSTAGVYTVMLTNTSNIGCQGDTVVMPVTVQPRAQITTALVSQTVCPGANVTYTAVASGTGLSFAWKKNGVLISGATSNTYTITGVTAADAGTYRVIVTGNCNADSSNATLTVNAVTAIGTQPQTQTACPSGPVTFTVAATGAGLTYQWQKNGSPISGATLASYTIASATAADAGSYTVVVTGTCGTVTSNAAVLTINTSTSITTQPAATQAVCAGTAATFTVAATGAGTLTYQWQKNGSPISGATSATYTIASTTATDAATYTVVVTGSCGASVTSANAVLTVNPITVITSQPTAQAVCAGSAASFTVAATGAGVVYQWRKDGNPITGATLATYTIASASAGDAGTYTVVVSGACGTLTSASAVLTVNAVTAITAQPAATQTVCAGTPASFTVTAVGAGLTYQWSKNGSPITGATAASLNIAATTAADAGTYTVLVTGTCGTVTSANAVLTVNPVTAITTQPTATQAACPGTNVTLTVAATGTGLTYQWSKNGTAIAAATSATLNLNVVTAADAATYTVVVTGSCGTVTSANAVLTVNTAASIITQPTATQTVCAGSAASFTVAATGTGVTYQWRRNGNNIAGATSATYSIASASVADAGTYTVIVTGTCGTVTSANAVLTVNAATSINTQPVAQAVCAGSAATFTVNATGTGTLTYQWRKDGTAITGATAATYSIASVSAADAGAYTVVVTGTCGTVTSTAANLSLNAASAISAQPVAVDACQNTPAVFTVTATGAGLTYQWRKNGTAISGATSATYTIPSATAADAGTYTVIITGSCGTVTSGAAALTVNSCAPVTTINGTINAATLRPSAAHNYTNIVIQSSRAVTIKWQLIDAKGAIVKTFSQNVVPGENTFRLDLSSVASGAYFLNGFSEGAHLTVLRLVKQ
jgi:hypothetical protein